MVEGPQVKGGLMHTDKVFHKTDDTDNGVMTRNAAIRAMYESGDGVSKIAKTFSLSTDAIYKVVSSLQIKGFCRESTYNPNLPGLLLEWFKDKSETLRQETIIDVEKKKVKRETIDLPDWKMFCVEHEIRPRTFRSWIEKGNAQLAEGDKFVKPAKAEDFREIAEAYEVCQDIYENMLVKGALNFKLQPIFAMFLAKNRTSLRDVKAVEFTDTVKKEMLERESMGSKKMKDLRSILELDGKDIDEITDSQAISVLKLMAPKD